MLETEMLLRNYYSRYLKYSFHIGEEEYLDRVQYESVIIKEIHSIEKGLATQNYLIGSGKEHVMRLVNILKKYSEKFDVENEVFRTAISALETYKKKNAENRDVSEAVSNLKGISNGDGGIDVLLRKQQYFDTYQEVLKSRRSVRHFNGEAVDVGKIREALEISRNTPSACNRQGWRVRLVADKKKMKEILRQQNGNRGFGDEIDKLMIITYDLRCLNSDREVFQGFIDGGMYAMNVLNSLQYVGIAAIPLSASLHAEQDKTVREIAQIEDSEILIVFIGCGNYCSKYKVPKSHKKQIDMEII